MSFVDLGLLLICLWLMFDVVCCHIMCLCYDVVLYVVKMCVHCVCYSLVFVLLFSLLV